MVLVRFWLEGQALLEPSVISAIEPIRLGFSTIQRVSNTRAMLTWQYVPSQKTWTYSSNPFRRVQAQPYLRRRPPTIILLEKNSLFSRITDHFGNIYQYLRIDQLLCNNNTKTISPLVAGGDSQTSEQGMTPQCSMHSQRTVQNNPHSTPDSTDTVGLALYRRFGPCRSRKRL